MCKIIKSYHSVYVKVEAVEAVNSGVSLDF